MTFCQQPYYRFETFGRSKDGVKQTFKLVLQFSLALKEKIVNDLGQTFAWLKIGQIVRYASHGHICLCNIIATQSHALRKKHLLGLFERDGRQAYLCRGAVIESTIAINEVIFNPRGSTTTDNHHQIVLAGSPAIPEMLKCTDKARTRCVHPRHFINKNDHSFLRILLGEKISQPLECFGPILRPTAY